MTDLFREVEEDLRREQFSNLWEKYSTVVIGLAVAVVLIAAAIVGWRAWSHSQRAEASIRLGEVVKEAEKASPEEAAAAFAALADETSGGYKTLARLHEADRLLEADKRTAAMNIYEDVAAGRAPDIIRGMATVKAGLIAVDTASYDDMKARMEPLLNEESPWRQNALELLALAAMREGAWADADSNVQAIIEDQTVPSGLRDRAHVIQALVAPHLPRPAEETAAPVVPEDTAVEPASGSQPESQDAPARAAPADTE